MDRIESVNDRIRRFKEARNFVVYYGPGKEQDLGSFDVAIIEPGLYDNASVEKTKKKGTIVLAYVSVMEVHKMIYGYNMLRQEDYLRIDGNVVINKEYGTKLVNLCSPRWNSILIHYIGDLIFNRGFDGVFLDTLEDMEFSMITQDIKSMLISAAVKLIAKIKLLYPDCILVQNNCVGRLLPLTIKLIHGVCWENPLLPITKLEPALETIDYLCSSEDVRLMLLYEEQYRNFVHKSLMDEYLLYIARDRYIGEIKSPK